MRRIILFLSAFGLFSSYINQGEGYITRLPKRRILPLYINYLILIVVYLSIALMLGNDFKGVLLIESLLIGGTYVANGWYLQTLLLFYLFFWVTFILKIPDKYKILLIFCLTVMYYITGSCLEFFLHTGYFGYASIFMFPLGTFYAFKRSSVENILNKHRISTFIIALILIFTAGIMLLTRKKLSLPGFLTVFQSTYITMAFAIGVLLLLNFFNLSFTRFLGKYSFEIYVLQGIGFIIASSNWLHISNLYVQLAVSIMITAILCVPFHYLFEYVKSLFRKENKIKRNE